jgi:hypothetical protein
MTTRKKHKTKLLAVEAVAGDRDLMKALMKEALQEIGCARGFHPQGQGHHGGAVRSRLLGQHDERGTP